MVYGLAAARLRRPLNPAGGLDELVRAATLAANSHNTQPWRFRHTDDGLAVAPDPQRRCPVVDPDDHHLWISLGCALENLVRAAPVLGRHAEPEVAGDGTTVVHLAPTAAVSPARAAPILAAQCTRRIFAGGTIDPAVRTALLQAAAGDGVEVIYEDDAAARAELADLVVEAERRQLADPAFRAELFTWMRCTDVEAERSGDGLSGRVMGVPALPRAAVRALLPLILHPRLQADRRRRELASSSGLAVFVGVGETPRAWLAVGRSYQRFSLAAAELGLRHAFVNQPLEVAACRPALARWAGVAGARPDLAVRLGWGPAAPYSLRRPVDAVLTGRSVG